MYRREHSEGAATTRILAAPLGCSLADQNPTTCASAVATVLLTCPKPRERQMNPQPFGGWDDAPTSGATRPGLPPLSFLDPSPFGLIAI